MLFFVINFDTDGEPTIALAPSHWTNRDAQIWVRENQAPMVVFDGGIQFILVYLDASGSPVLEPFWPIKTQVEAVQAARKVLAGKTKG
jgi:hypothetical protein